jgi:hypothetical protein
VSIALQRKVVQVLAEGSLEVRIPARGSNVLGDLGQAQLFVHGQRILIALGPVLRYMLTEVGDPVVDTGPDDRRATPLGDTRDEQIPSLIAARLVHQVRLVPQSSTAHSRHHHRRRRRGRADDLLASDTCRLVGLSVCSQLTEESGKESVPVSRIQGVLQSDDSEHAPLDDLIGEMHQPGPGVGDQLRPSRRDHWHDNGQPGETLHGVESLCNGTADVVRRPTTTCVQIT